MACRVRCPRSRCKSTGPSTWASPAFGRPMNPRIRKTRWRCSTSRCDCLRRHSPASKEKIKMNLSELLGALPADEKHDPAGLANEELREIYTDLARRPVPLHSLHRLWSTGE